MATKLEELQALFDETFEGYTLAASRAAEWLSDFGYDECVAAVKITAEQEYSNPLSYTFGVLRNFAKQRTKPVSKKGFDPELRRRYEQFVADGELTADEMNLLIKARTCGEVDSDALFEAEYRLRRSVYPNSRNWLPPSAGHWMRQVWWKLSDEERMIFSPVSLRQQSELLKSQWANSGQFQDMSKMDAFDKLMEMGES